MAGPGITVFELQCPGMILSGNDLALPGRAATATRSCVVSGARRVELAGGGGDSRSNWPE